MNKLNTREQRAEQKVPVFLDTVGITVGRTRTHDCPTVEIVKRTVKDADGSFDVWGLSAGGKLLGGFLTSWEAYYAVSAHLDDRHIKFEGIDPEAERSAAILAELDFDFDDDDDD